MNKQAPREDTVVFMGNVKFPRLQLAQAILKVSVNAKHTDDTERMKDTV